MATENDTAATKAISLSENETKLFISIMKNLESDISFNADAVAQECGYKSAKVVKDRWSQIKKNKLGIASAKATPAKKRKGEGEAGGQADETPTKKARTPKSKGKKEESPAKEEVVKEEEDEEDGDDGEK